MARLGIDFGTTNTVASIHDRGMFSIVLHGAQTGAGTVVQETYPSAILVERTTGRQWFGLEAERRFAQLPASADYLFVPSLKRRLRDYTAHGDDGSSQETASLLTGFLKSLADSVRQSQMIPDDEPLETVITWPANANGAQRHITRACFRAAGFEVIGTLNEPTASAIELADWLTAGRGKKGNGKNAKAAEPMAVAVFDLGGGTFDASLVWIENQDFRVISSAGIENLGGDDFDRVLLEMFLAKLGTSDQAMNPLTRQALIHQARSQKESISTGAVRSLFLNPADYGLNGRPVTIPVAAYYDRIRPMLTPAIKMLKDVIASAATKQAGIEDGPRLTVYLVGGSSKLPLVGQMVADAFPASKVVLTDKPFRSVAMGAAICAMDRVTFRDVFARHFGLLRLRDHGRVETFDTIFPAGTPIPRKGETPLERVAWYHPAHNVGHLRYLECTEIGQDGLPDGSVRAWSDIFFPYDPGKPLTAPLDVEDIHATDAYANQPVCEVYRCDADGVITVELRRPSSNDSRCYEIYDN